MDRLDVLKNVGEGEGQFHSPADLAHITRTADVKRVLTNLDRMKG